MEFQKPKVLGRDALLKLKALKDGHQYVATQRQKHVAAHAVATNFVILH